VASAELRGFANATQAVQISSHVESHLRQEFRAQHHVLKTRRTTVIRAWALAAAAVLVAAVSWQIWHANHPNRSDNQVARSLSGTNTTENGNNSTKSAGNTPDAGSLVAENSDSGFTLLPGSLPSDTEAAAIVRVRMQRGGLTALGLPVNEERASDWIQVDLLVGNDGLPQAVRLPQETRTTQE
jgi:hypothetical protein